MGSLDVVESETGQGVAAVNRALSIIAALESVSSPQTLAQVAAATQLYKSTILRLLGSLETAGYVARLRDGRYALGPMAFRLGLAYERGNPVREHVLPVLEDLVAEGGESASFHVRQGAGTRICLLRVDSQHSTLDRVRVGDTFPLDRGAAGRVILAFSGAPGPPYDQIRADHFAISIGERDPNCAGMAAPVFSASGMLEGALSLSGPGNRFKDEMILTFRPKLQAAAAVVTKALGGLTA